MAIVLASVGLAAIRLGPPARTAVLLGAASARLVSVGAWALFVGVAIATLDSVSVVSQALRPQDVRSERDVMRTVLADRRNTT